MKELMYSNGGIHLPRKKKIFDSIIVGYKRDYSKTNRKRKVYSIISPKGDNYIIDNLPDFCKKMKLKYSTMSNLSRNIGNSSHGWTCKIN